jgi:hypothetical protein
VPGGDICNWIGGGLARMVQRKGWPLEALPWEAKGFDSLELPKPILTSCLVGLSGTVWLLDRLNI